MSKRKLLLGVSLFLVSALALAQTTGSVRGTTVDAEGAPLPGVVLEIAGDLVRGERTQASRANGSFSFTAIPAGEVTLTAKLGGFQDQSIPLRVNLGGSLTVRLIMQLEAITETLIVTSEAPLVDVTSSAVGTNYTSDFIEDLPTNRNFWDVMTVAPGISVSSEGSSRFSAFGSGTSSNAFHVDGIDTTAADTGSSWWWINPDQIEEIQVIGIGTPAEYGQMMGAAFNVVTKSGTNALGGALRYYGQFDSLTWPSYSLPDSSNPEFKRDHFRHFTGALGGPFKRDKVWFFANVESTSEAYSQAGAPPELAEPFKTERYDLKVSISLNDSNTLDLKGHYEDYDFNFSESVVDEFTDPSALGHEFGTNPAWGLNYNSVLTSNTFFEVQYAGWTGDDFWHSRTGSTEPPYGDYTVEPNVFTGGLLWPYDYFLDRDQVDVKLSHFADDFIKGDHDLKFGVSYTKSFAKTLVQYGAGGTDYYFKYPGYYYGYDYYGTYYGPYYYGPYYYKYSVLPHYYGSEQETFSAFIDDSWRITDKLTLNIGVRFDKDTALIPAYERLNADSSLSGVTLPGQSDALDWKSWSPRLGFAYQIGEGVLRGSFGRYYEGSVSGNWNWPPPGVPDFIYSYSSQIASGQGYQNAGPYIEYDRFTSDNIAPGVFDSPETDQYALGFEHQIGRHMSIGIQTIYKESKNLLGFEILGDGVYEMVPFTDPVTGQVIMLASILERPTVRKGNCPGVGSLAPPGACYATDYKGAFVTFNKRYSNGWSLMASYTRSESKGLHPRPLSQGQGNPLYGGLEGSDPNNHINSEQLLQADRKNMLQVHGRVDLPWDLHVTGVLTIQDGRPYAQRARAPSGLLEQGIFYSGFIVVPANDDQRLPSQTILDLGLGRKFPVGDQVSLNIDLQLFNVFNEDANEFWDGSDYARGTLTATNRILPRRLMVKLGVNF